MVDSIQHDTATGATTTAASAAKSGTNGYLAGGAIGGVAGGTVSVMLANRVAKPLAKYAKQLGGKGGTALSAAAAALPWVAGWFGAGAGAATGATYGMYTGAIKGAAEGVEAVQAQNAAALAAQEKLVDQRIDKIMEMQKSQSGSSQDAIDKARLEGRQEGAEAVLGHIKEQMAAHAALTQNQPAPTAVAVCNTPAAEPAKAEPEMAKVEEPAAAVAAATPGAGFAAAITPRSSSFAAEAPAGVMKPDALQEAKNAPRELGA